MVFYKHFNFNNRSGNMVIKVILLVGLWTWCHPGIQNVGNKYLVTGGIHAELLLTIFSCDGVAQITEIIVAHGIEHTFR